MFDTSRKRRRINRRKKRRAKKNCRYIPILLVYAVLTAFSPRALHEINNVSSQKLIDDFMSLRTPPDTTSIALVMEAQNSEMPVREPLEPVHVQTVSYKTMATQESSSAVEDEKVPHPNQSQDKRKSAATNKYYVQVGSFKDFKDAEEIVTILRSHYLDVNIVMQKDFYKVRIPGIMTKKQAARVSQHVEEEFNMKPLLVQNMLNVSLADAVRPFIGASYSRIDCYGLIVRGLMNQGVQYHGHGGLREKLENMAQHDGLPDNAYLNGEGLIAKTGTRIFSNSIQRISNTQEKTDTIYSQITPYLREGLVLSFSTTTRGHTGIVSRWEDDWTYINSGLIDNHISSGEVSERVGEEFLKAEIKNWVVLASARKEPLTVTLGQLDAGKLREMDRLKETNKLTASNIYQPVINTVQ